MRPEFSFTSKLWATEGFGAWYFVTLPIELSAEIKEQFSSPKQRGWGSIYATATIGKTAWQTSIFPSKEGYYMLAIKAEVRKKEGISEGDSVTVVIRIRTI